MSDDVKALRRRLITGEAPIDEVLAHIDGEKERTLKAVTAERAAIVAWLRCEKRAAPINGGRFDLMCRLADSIEKGAHYD